MANEKNLKKGKATQFHSGEEAARNGKKGGIASGESKRRKRSMREAAKLLMGMAVTNEKMQKVLENFDLTEEDMTNEMAIVASITMKAWAGNVEAAKFLRETLGESPTVKLREKDLELRREQFEYQKRREGSLLGDQRDKENNLLDALIASTTEEISTDDIPEIQQTPEHSNDLVEQAEPE